MSKSLKIYAATALGIGLTLTLSVMLAERNIAPMPEDPPLLGRLPDPAPASPAPPPESGLIAAAHADEAGESATFGIGREALPEELAAWDLDVSPDGTGLPEGSGDVATGEELFVERCAACHGDFAEGVGNWPALAGGEGTLADEDPVKTVGSYWPYLSTAWDYVHRSMPFGNAQTLTADETYAITAYILYSNWIVEEDFTLSRDTFDEVEMPNADGFIVDDRPETEYAKWRAEPCMEACKDGVEIIRRATSLNVTPEDDFDVNPVTGGAFEAASASVPEPEPETAPEATSDPEPEAGPDPALVAEGEKVFRQCKACHQVGEGAANRVGPHLNGILGRDIAAAEGFRYSGAMEDMEGTWDDDRLAEFLADPRGTVRGTRMAFAGLRDEADIEAVIAYLHGFE
ncbi:c-type cytochrome [Allosediminivita pacifica]|uniref:Sulfur dehydrogenase subunit SoxD n=1 Tax=Allosediminivita pacifica TaxID=1267769 RepID=A0A2T6BAJ6_9RHOB|nr:c-type cytochrome [Allosediminivita pacifica]PTX53052.1 sulfur dehydrogenase subunit SoxD [Allosediminivita pacifica]GGA93455.1 hypothetical protein GCM10011324_00020 [Allosediminivita pacifica]